MDCHVCFQRYIDGAWSDNLPRINNYTITVSPFAGRSDICPKDDSANVLHMFLANTSVQFSAMNLYRMSRIMFPPHPEKLSEICKSGFEDALAFLKKNSESIVSISESIVSISEPIVSISEPIVSMCVSFPWFCLLHSSHSIELPVTLASPPT